jgi:hypothetical protein
MFHAPRLAPGLNLGVAGAALAATLASWVSAVMLVGLMFKKRLLRAADLATRPEWEEVVPYLSQGLMLAFRMILTMGAPGLGSGRGLGARGWGWIGPIVACEAAPASTHHSPYSWRLGGGDGFKVHTGLEQGTTS